MVGAPLRDKISPIIGNTGGAVVTLITFSVLTLALIWLVVPPIVQQARNFTSIDYEKVLMSLEEPMNDWNDWLIEKGILTESVSVEEQRQLEKAEHDQHLVEVISICLLYTSPSPRD